MLLIRHAVLHPDGLRHVNLEAQPGSKAGRQWFHNFRQYRVLAGLMKPIAHAYVSRRIEYWTCHYLMEWS